MSRNNPYIPGVRPNVGNGLPGRPQRANRGMRTGVYTRQSMPPGCILLDGVTALSKSATDAGMLVPAYSAYRMPKFLARNATTANQCVEFYEDDAYMVQLDAHSGSGSESLPGLRIFNTKDPENIVQVPYAATPKVTAQPIDLSLNPQGVGVCVCQGAYAPVLVFLRDGDTFTTVSTARPSQLAGVSVTMVALSPDGRWAVFATTDSAQMLIYRLDVSGALSYVQTIISPQTNCCGLWWLYDGSLMAARGDSSLSFSLYRYRLNGSGTEFGVGSAMGAAIARGADAVHYSRSGLSKDRKRFAHVVSFTSPHNIRVLEIGDSTVTTLATFATGGSIGGTTVFSADGNSVLSPQWYSVEWNAIRRILVYDIATATSSGQLSTYLGDVGVSGAPCALFTSSSRRLLSFIGYNNSNLYFARVPEVGYGGGLYAAIAEA